MNRAYTFILVLFVFVHSIPSSAQTHLRVRVTSTYTSNPFNLRDSWRADFDSKNVAGQRFEGFGQVNDVVTVVGGELRQRLRSKSGTRFDLRSGVTYHEYALNSHGSYLEINASAEINPKGPAAYKLDVSLTPRRHRKNYHLPTGLFATGKYSEAEARASYKRKLRSGLRSHVFMRVGGRKFEKQDFNRDRIETYAGFLLDARLAKRRHLLLTGWIGGGRTVNGLDIDAAVDRSFNAVGGKLEFKAHSGATVYSLWVRTRLREYTSDDPADSGFYNRSDTRWKVGADWRRRLSKRLKVGVDGQYKRNASDQLAGELDEDVIPYSGFAVGGGFRVSL